MSSHLPHHIHGCDDISSQWLRVSAKDSAILLVLIQWHHTKHILIIEFLPFCVDNVLESSLNSLLNSLPTVCLYVMIVFHAVISGHYCLPHYDMCLLFDSVITKGKVKGKVHPITGSHGQEGE